MLHSFFYSEGFLVIRGFYSNFSGELSKKIIAMLLWKKLLIVFGLMVVFIALIELIELFKKF